MSFDSMLRHRVTIVRDVAGATLDSYRHAVVTPTEIATLVPASIQPKSVRELALQDDAGGVVSDYTVYLRPRDLTEADRIEHARADCPVAAAVDLPDATYLVRGVRNPAGAGHHLEVDVTAIAPRAAEGS